MTVADVVSEVEAAGAALRLEGEKIRVWYPDEERRRELAVQIALLRDWRAEVGAYLKIRNAAPQMPPGVRLVEWNLKKPPIALETCSIVIEPALFAQRTLDQLRRALENPKHRVGWTIPQLIDRLRQAGVAVIVDLDEK